MKPTSRDVLLRAEHLTKEFRSGGGVVHAVSDVSFEIYRGETLALVGESGCGKSTLGRLLLRLLRPTSGTVMMDGKDLTAMSDGEMRRFRRNMQLVFQDPYTALDPRMTVKKIIGEPLRAFGVHRTERQRIVMETAEQVGIPVEFLDRYPHQFSGGQRQRIGIARALALQPSLIVCDEPVSALDVSIQAQILNLLHDLQQQFGVTYLFISHDLSVVHYVSDRVCVMFLGKICEIGDCDEIFSAPRHPYTKFLLAATPKLDPRQKQDAGEILKGEIPSPMHPPSGCRFRTRCPYATERCAQEEPVLQGENGHLAACHYPLHE